MPRAVDIALAVVALIITAPILVICALAVTISSPGPIIFRQRRIGRRGQPFTFYKFRTMCKSDTGPQITAEDDPRITRIGRFLRKTKLDEVPGFWNVLKGDMAIVGARPEVPYYVNLNDSRWRFVLLARPGLTDPVTARLRREEQLLTKVGGDKQRFYEERLLPFKLDGYVKYLARRSAWTDLAALGDTFVAILGAGTSALLLYKKRWHILADAAIGAFAFSLAYLLRFDFSIPKSEMPVFWRQLPFVVLLELIILILSGVYRFIWRYISISDLKPFLLAGLLSSSLLLAMRLALTAAPFYYWRVPISVLIINAGSAISTLIAVRVVRRLIYERFQRNNRNPCATNHGKTRVLLIGAGTCGRALLREIRSNVSIADIQGFVDDDRNKAQSIIQGVRVVGNTEELPLLVHELAIDTVVLTMARPSRDELLRILNICERIPVQVKIVPSVWQLIDDKEQVNGREPAEISDAVMISGGPKKEYHSLLLDSSNGIGNHK